MDRKILLEVVVGTCIGSFVGNVIYVIWKQIISGWSDGNEKGE